MNVGSCRCFCRVFGAIGEHRGLWVVLSRFHLLISRVAETMVLAKCGRVHQASNYRVFEGSIGHYDIEEQQAGRGRKKRSMSVVVPEKRRDERGKHAGD